MPLVEANAHIISLRQTLRKRHTQFTFLLQSIMVHYHICTGFHANSQTLFVKRSLMYFFVI